MSAKEENLNYFKNELVLNSVEASHRLKFVNKNGDEYTFKDNIKNIQDVCENYIKLETKLEIAIQALEFYANFNSWNGNPDYRLEMSIIENEDWDFVEENEEGNYQSYGGKHAREALERIKNGQ